MTYQCVTSRCFVDILVAVSFSKNAVPVIKHDVLQLTKLQYVDQCMSHILHVCKFGFANLFKCHFRYPSPKNEQVHFDSVES